MGMHSLPPGFRFHPTSVELMMYFLKKKVMRGKLRFEVISELDIYKYAPWDLPDKSCLKTGDLKWYFFCPVAKKYSYGSRMSRSTDTGFWKVTGKDRTVDYRGRIVGSIKTLVFHIGRAPKGNRTDWVMHEYRLEDSELADSGIAQTSYVLCEIFEKGGRGPRNGAQYGAPFNEQDWDDDAEAQCAAAFCPLLKIQVNPIVTDQSLPVNDSSEQVQALAPDVHLPDAEQHHLNDPIPINVHSPGSLFAGLSERAESQAQEADLRHNFSPSVTDGPSLPRPSEVELLSKENEHPSDAVFTDGSVFGSVCTDLASESDRAQAAAVHEANDLDEIFLMLADFADGEDILNSKASLLSENMLLDEDRNFLELCDLDDLDCPWEP